MPFFFPSTFGELEPGFKSGYLSETANRAIPGLSRERTRGHRTLDFEQGKQRRMKHQDPVKLATSQDLGNTCISGKSRLVKHYHLARSRFTKDFFSDTNIRILQIQNGKNPTRNGPEAWVIKPRKLEKFSTSSTLLNWFQDRQSSRKQKQNLYCWVAKIYTHSHT